MTTSATELTVRHLAKAYRGRRVVEDLSFDIRAGEVVGLLGPNGAGKTTCFYMVLGLTKADAGSIHLGDRDISNEPLHARARAGIGYLPQEASVFRKLSVEDNLKAVIELRDDLDRAAGHALIEALVAEFNLERVRKTTGERLSGGERRRVEIARALATEPSYVLLDEPFAGVDPISVAEIKNEIRRLAERNIGVLITDHNVRETLDICDRAYIVNAGTIIAHGSAEAILSNPTVRSVYLGEQFKL